jgi:hypothetical protein
MSQINPPNQAAGSGNHGLRSAALVALAIVAVLSLAFAGYTTLNPHTVTVTQPQMLTNTQNLYSVQTQTVVTENTVISVTTVTNMQQSGYGYGYGYGNYQSCNYYYGCSQSPGYNYYPGYYYGSYGYNPPCQYAGSNNAVTCYGYYYQAGNGCTLLVVPTTSNPYPSYATGYVYEYYTLHNLPSNTPQLGAWVTVNGQLYQGYNTASNGASCPNNYIIVNTIS